MPQLYAGPPAAASTLEATYKSVVATDTGTHMDQTQEASARPLNRFRRRRESAASDEAAGPSEVAGSSRVDFASSEMGDVDMDIQEPDMPTPPQSPPKAPSPKRDAFSLLMAPKITSGKDQKRDKRKGNVGEFMEDQAEESEDETWGVAGGDDQDEDAEDDGADLEGLVVEEDRSEEQIAADKVLADEKRREIEAADDKRDLQIHREAAEGQLRNKKRDRGTGWDLSGDEDDDDPRPKLKKRDLRQLRELGKDFGESALTTLSWFSTDFSTLERYSEEPFRRFYEKDCLPSDDDDDIPYEDDETQAAMLRRRLSVSPPPEPRGLMSMAVDENDVRTETMDAGEIRRQVRDFADKKRDELRERKRQAEEDAERGVPVSEIGMLVPDRILTPSPNWWTSTEQEGQGWRQ